MVARRAVLFLLLFVTLRAGANDMTVEPRQLQMNDHGTITISLEGPFAALDSVNVPLDNLAFVGEPWVASEFAWINGEVVRRKVFRFRVRALLPGPATVGPVALAAPDGQRDTLRAFALQVIGDRVAVTNDPEALLRELVATGRPPLFLVAEADKKQVWEGEQILVTWWLYNAAVVENWQIVSVPKLTDFWLEEVDARASEAERVYVGDRMMHRVMLRRVALYAIRSGALQIGGMALEASVMERVRPFRSFEGNLVETTFTSAPLTIQVRALPPGPRVDAIGELALACDLARQKGGGPVVVDATLAGAGNLRAASPPRFVREVAGDVRVEGGEAVVTRESGIGMARRWRYLIFPRGPGVLDVPPLAISLFVPSTGERKTLQCGGDTVWSEAVAPPASGGGQAILPVQGQAGLPDLHWFIAFGAFALFLAIATPRILRELRIRREAQAIVGASDIRAEIDARFGGALLAEKTDRGDAYRALRSLLDAKERDRDIAVDADAEILRRVRELLRVSPA